MAKQAKEGAQLNRKSSSEPSTLRRRLRRRAANPEGDTTVFRDKSMPNYLKPTLSSCGSNVCQYPTSHQLPQPAAVAAVRKSTIAKPALSSPVPQVKERSSKVSFLLPKPNKPFPDKAPKPAALKNVNAPKLKTSRSLSKETSGTSKRREGKQRKKEKELENEVGIISSPPKKKLAGENDNEKMHEEKIHYEGSKNSADTTKPRTPRAKATSFSDEDETKMEVKFEQGRGTEMIGNSEVRDQRETRPIYNEVIAETTTMTSKVAGWRNNVKALVGAFETVISSESQLSTLKGEETKFSKSRGRAGAGAESDKEGQHENLEDEMGQQEESKVAIVIEVQQSEEEEEEEEESKSEANQSTTESNKEDEGIEGDNSMSTTKEEEEEEEDKSNATEKNNAENN